MWETTSGVTNSKTKEAEVIMINREMALVIMEMTVGLQGAE
jgi:hypothetical protein